MFKSASKLRFLITVSRTAILACSVIAVLAAGFAACRNNTLALGSKVDIMPPVVYVKEPVPGAFISGITTVRIEATDDGEVETVDIRYTYRKGNNDERITRRLKQDASGEYIYELDTTVMDDGEFSLVVTATDNSGKQTITPSLIYTVKNNPPKISMQIPRPNVNRNSDGIENWDVTVINDVVYDTFLMGVYEDLAGVAPGFPWIKIWRRGTPEPVYFNENAGWENVNSYIELVNPNDSSDTGWIKADEGLVTIDRGEKGGSFRYYLRGRKHDGTHEGESVNPLDTGVYNLKILARDINGKTRVWPGDDFAEARYMTFNITATGIPPSVTFDTPVDLFQNENFEIKTTAIYPDAESAIAYMYINVNGVNGMMTLAAWACKNNPPTTQSNILVFTVEIGETYFVTRNEEGIVAEKLGGRNLEDVNAANWVTFGDGDFNFVVLAASGIGVRQPVHRTIYIDRIKPTAEITSVNPIYRQNEVSGDIWRSWTVNSTTVIAASYTDNNGTARYDTGTNAGKTRFKYYFSPSDDIETTYVNIKNYAGERKYAHFYNYLYSHAKFFDDARGFNLPADPYRVTESGGAYTLTLQTHRFNNAVKYDLYMYIVAMDRAGNINWQKIHLNIDQNTDIPKIDFRNVALNGSTFMDNTFVIQLTLVDDDGFTGPDFEYRFAKNKAEKDDNSPEWKLFSDGILSVDRRTITVNNLTLTRIRNDYGGLGDEIYPKFIQVRVRDDASRKALESDGSTEGITDWIEFKIDTRVPEVIPSAKDLGGIPINRNEENPFGAPERGGSYRNLPFAYGDLVEQNLKEIIIRINGEMRPDPNQDNIVVQGFYPTGDQPAGDGFAVWRTVNENWAGEIRWRIPMAEIFNTLNDGANTFEITFIDKALQSTIRSFAFFKDQDGPEINMIIPGGEVFLNNTELAAINNFVNGGYVLTGYVKEKYNRLVELTLNDSNGRITGNFTDSFSDVFSADNHVFYYRFNNAPWVEVDVRDENGNVSGSRSVTWSIPVPPENGFHRLSIRVKDSKGNGYGITAADETLLAEDIANADKTNFNQNKGPGYINNLALLLDSQAPRIIPDGQTNLGVAKKILGITGRIEETFRVESLVVMIGEIEAAVFTNGTPEHNTAITPVSDSAKRFNFNIAINLNDYAAFLEDGVNTISITAVGSSGRSTTVSRTFTYDDSAPVISLGTPIREPIFLTDEQFNVINAAIEENNLTNLPENLLEVYNALMTASVKDLIASYITGTITDSYSPVFSNVRDKYWFKITGGSSDGEWKEVFAPRTNGNVSGSRNEELRIPIADLEDGVYRLNIRVQDSLGNGFTSEDERQPTPDAGNTGPGFVTNLTFMVDRATPQFVTDASILNTTDMTFSGQITNTFDVAGMDVRVNGHPFSGDGVVSHNRVNGNAKTFNFNITSFIDSGFLNEGANSISIMARGSSGQTAIFIDTVIYDTQPPQIRFTSPINVNNPVQLSESSLSLFANALTNNTIHNLSGEERELFNRISSMSTRNKPGTITGTFVDTHSNIESTFNYRINNNEWITATVAFEGGSASTTGSWLVPIPVNMAEGLHRMSIRVKDAAGNTEETADVVFLVDTGTPVIRINDVDTGIPAVNTDNEAETNVDYGVQRENFTISGTIENTFEVRTAAVRLGGFEIPYNNSGGIVITPNGNRKFDFLINVPVSAFIENPPGVLTSFGDGFYTVFLNAEGSSRQTAMSMINFVLDTTGPVISFSPPLGNKVHLTRAQYDAITAGTADETLNEIAAGIASRSISDQNARISGTFADQHSAIFRAADISADDAGNIYFYYRIHEGDGRNILTGNGNPETRTTTWSRMRLLANENDANAGSRSLSWSIPLVGTDLPVFGINGVPDGLYLIDIRVKDRLGNGFGENDAPDTIGGGGGFENNLAFNISRSVPTFSPLPRAWRSTLNNSGELEIAKDKHGERIPLGNFFSRDFFITGTVNDTPSVKKLEIIFNGPNNYELIYEAGANNDGNITIIPAGNTHDFIVRVPASTHITGSYSITITATGASDMSVTSVLNYTLDMTPPGVRFIIPSAGSINPGNSGALSHNNRYEIRWPSGPVTGRDRIIGTTDDSNGVEKIYYYLGTLQDDYNLTHAQREVLYNNANWIDTGLDSDPVTFWEGGLYYWTFSTDYIDFIDRRETGGNLAAVDPNQSQFHLPLYVKVIDRAGNFTIVHYKLLVDPDQDIPRVEIESPAINSLVGGPQRISGTATDNVWIRSVEIRIIDTTKNSTDPDYYYLPEGSNFAYPGDPANPGWIRIPLATNQLGENVNWNFTINNNDKLTPPSGQIRPVIIEARALDFKDFDDILSDNPPPNLKSAVLQWPLTFDSGIPRIENVQVNDGNETRDFVPGIRVAGEFTVTAVVRDEGGIETIRARVSGDPNYYLIVRSGEIISDPHSSFNEGLRQGWTIDAEMPAPMNSWQGGWRYYITNPGSWTQQQWAQFGEENDLSWTPGKEYRRGVSIQLKYGASGLTGDAIGIKAKGTIANTIADENNDSENWRNQAFEYRLSFRINSTSFINYGRTGNFNLDIQVTDNNIPPYTTTGNYAIQVDNTYPSTTITTQYNAVTRRFPVSGTATDVADGSGIHQGLERVLVYFSRMSGGTRVFFNAQGEVNTGMVTRQNVRDIVKDIDNGGGIYTGAAPNWTGDNVFENFPHLSWYDGANPRWRSPHAIVIDQPLTAEEQEWGVDGHRRNWSALVDTTKFADGPLSIHYIVMDKAGNATHYREDVFVGNNRPIIRDFQLGTSFSATGDIEYFPRGSSWIVSTAEGVIERTQAIDTNFIIRNNRFNINLNTLFGNHQKYYRVTYVHIGNTVNATVMGNGIVTSGLVTGNVYIIETPGNTDWRVFGAPNNTAGTVFVARVPLNIPHSNAAPGPGTAVEYINAGGGAVLPGTEEKGKFETHGSSNGDNAKIAFNNFTSIPDTYPKNFNTAGNLIPANQRLFMVKIFDATIGGIVMSNGESAPPASQPEVNGINEANQLSHVVLIRLDVDNNDTRPPAISFADFGTKFVLNQSISNSTWSNDAHKVIGNVANYNENVVTQTINPGTVRERQIRLGYVRYAQDSQNYDGDKPNNNADISGRVIFKGKAMDNQRIHRIEAAIAGYNNGNPFVIAAWDDFARNGAGGLLAPNANNRSISAMAANDAIEWAFETENEYITLEYGHVLNWSFAWDSQRHASVAANNVTITFTVYDASGTPENFTNSLNAETDTTVNITPYITEIVTHLSRVMASNPSSFNRSALGGYPVREDEVIQIRGFNLNGDTGVIGYAPTVTVVTADTPAQVYTLVRPLTRPAANAPDSMRNINIRVDNNTTDNDVNTVNSGDLVVTVNGVSSLNHRIRNASTNDWPQERYNYNQEPNGLNNDILTNRRYLYVWNTGSLLSDRLALSPFMRMNETATMFLSYGRAATAGSATGGHMRVRVNNNETTIDQHWNRFVNTTVAFDEAGSWYAAGSNLAATGNPSFSFYARGGSTTTHGNNAVNRRVIFRLADAAGSIDADRAKIPRIFAQNTNGTSTGNNDFATRIFLSYFDQGSANKEVRFHYGLVGAIGAATTGTGGDFSTSAPTTSASAGQIIADDTTLHRGSMYTAVGALKNGLPVIAWYDREFQNLVFSHGGNSLNTRPLNGTPLTTGISSEQTSIGNTDAVSRSTEFVYTAANHGLIPGTNIANSVIVNNTRYYVRRARTADWLVFNTDTTPATNLGQDVGDNITIIPYEFTGTRIAGVENTDNPLGADGNSITGTYRSYRKENHGLQLGDQIRVVNNNNVLEDILFVVSLHGNNKQDMKLASTYPATAASMYSPNDNDIDIYPITRHGVSIVISNATRSTEQYSTFSTDQSSHTGRTVTITRTNQNGTYIIAEAWSTGTTGNVYHVKFSTTTATAPTNTSPGAIQSFTLPNAAQELRFTAPAINTSFITTQTGATNNPASGTWQGNAVIVHGLAGSHVDMAVDQDDNIHLAYYDVINGGLWYAFIPAIDGTLTTARPNLNRIETARVDTYLSAGTRIMINIRREGNNNVPYISYYHGSFSETRNAIRVAWRKDWGTNFGFDSELGRVRTIPHGTDEHDSFTGAWEVMTIPTGTTPLVTEFVCNGVPASGSLTAIPTGSTLRSRSLENTIVVSYMTDAHYEGAVLKDNIRR
jgi:hypothetical protein